MKKILFAIVFAAFCFAGYTSQAQYKPTTGTFATEVSFNPFSLNAGIGGTNTISLPNLGVKGRYFFTDNLAGRVSLNFDYQSTTDHEFTAPGITPEVEQITSNSLLTFGLAPGVEYHFGDWEKMSLYCGAELGIMMLSASSSVENDGFTQGNNIDVSGASEFDGDPALSGFGFGLGVFTGFDYYFTKSLFVGVELGFSFMNFSSSEVEVTSASTTVTLKDYSSATSVGFYCEPAIRLGWKF